MVRQGVLALILVWGIGMTGFAQAASPAGQQYMRMLVGGPASVRDAAQGLYSTGLSEREVLDVLAEVLLRDYKKNDGTVVDALAWGCRVLGQVGDTRYRPVLQELATNAGHKKLRGYAKKALDSLPEGTKDAYRAGTVNLDKVRTTATAAPAASSASKGSTQTKASSSGKGKFGDIQNGMSIDDVVNLIGAPTSEYWRPTGKAFTPFYYGSDTDRMMYLYKGKGRVEFNRASRHSSVWRVVSIQPDSNESGYR